MAETRADAEMPPSQTHHDDHDTTAQNSSHTTTSNEHKQDDVLPSDSSTGSPDEKDAATAAPEAAPAAATAPPDDTKDFERASAGKRALVMFSLCMAVFLAALDVTIITTALPTISEEFQSASGYTWIGSAFLLANAASVPTWGKISDIFGRKPVLLVANVIFLVGSLVAALSNSIGMMIAARAVQGLGAGGLVILVNICVGDLFSLKNRGAYYGIIGGVWAIASAIGPIIGGAFTQKVTWRWCFYINLPLDGLAFIIILFFLDLKTPKTPLLEGLKAIDWVGSILVVGATLMFLFGLEYGGTTYPWKSATVICLIVFGLVTFAIFIIYEWRFAKYPVMPTSIFQTVSARACFFIVAIHGAVFIASSYYLPLYFQASRGASPISSGVQLLPTCVALSITSLGTGFYIRKTGRFLDCIYFGFIMMTLGNGLFIDYTRDSSVAKIVLYQGVAGFGIGPLFQSPLIALQSHIRPRDMATATATFGFVRQLSTSISVVIGGVIYQNQMLKKRAQLDAALGPANGEALAGAGAGANTQLINRLPQPGRTTAQDAFADSLSTMWILYVVLSGIGLVAVTLIRSKKLSATHEEARTGLDVEKENRAARKREGEERKARRSMQKGGTNGDNGDLEKSLELEKNTAANGEGGAGAVDKETKV